jgi:hypothetical protein
MEGNSSVYVSSKLYNVIDTTKHRVKRAARGAQLRAHNMDVLNHSSYFEAIQRPELFGDYILERGLVVLGKGLLGKAGSEPEGQQRLSREVREDALACGRQFHRWQEEREEARLRALGIQPRLHALLARNMLISRSSENVLVSIVAHRSLMNGLHAKRLLMPGTFETCPLPETQAMQVSKD